MDFVKEYSTVDSISTLPTTIQEFVTQYDAPGALAPPQTQQQINIVRGAIGNFVKIVGDYVGSNQLSEWHLSKLHLFDIVALGHIYNALKIFTRLGADNFEACYTDDNIKNLLKIYKAAIRLSTALMTTPTTAATDAPDATLAALIRLRIESSRVMQNMAILSSTKLCKIIHKTEVLEVVFSVLRDGVFTHYGINTQVVHDALVNNNNILTIGQLIGLTDLSHLLRCIVHVLAADSDLCLVKAGLLAELYKLFFKVSNLKPLTLTQLQDKSYQTPSNIGLYSPMLLDPRSVQMEFFKEVSEDVLGTVANKKEPLHIQFRIIINDFSRIFIVYGAMGGSGSEEHDSYIAEDCNGESDNDEQKLLENITIYQTFVERALVMLGAGIPIDKVPEAINTPVTAILTHDDILNKYYTPGGPLQYSKSQEALLVSYSNDFKTTQYATNDDDMVLPSGTTVVFENANSLVAVKTNLSKMLCRFPLKFCPFIVIHRYALTFIWKLFEGAIELLAPVPPENGFSDDWKLQNARTVSQYEHTDILPTFELLIKILIAAAEMEALAQENMTPENAQYYASLGLGSLASVVKRLLFGQYADIAVDNAHREVILAQMIKDGEEEERLLKIEAEKKALELEKQRELDEENKTSPEEDDTIDLDNDDGECDDFETFAEEAENPALKKANRRKMDMQEFLQSLPPQPKQYNTQMIAAGGVSEVELDDQGNKSLKARVLLLMLSPNYRVSALVQEFMYKIAAESSDEYIRLCGFGRAVGLLTGKGIPGFAHFAKNAINLDSFMGGKR